jgi:glycosyltransferase involved in cell wall biosynthesis
MRVSVICATIGPLFDVDRLLLSLHDSLRNVKSSIDVEFVLVDQSGAVDHQFPTSDLIRFLHIKNPARGLSINRNIGLDKASGEWILLMDSDCVIHRNYFAQFLLLARDHPHIDHFVGQIMDLDGKLPLFRKWPRTARRVSALRAWYYSTSVNNIFRSKATALRFDESFGLGAEYGSCEDVDFFLRLKSKALYSPVLITHHPSFSRTDIPREKLNSYSYGFGALCAKHVFPYGLGMLAMSIFKKMFGVITGEVSLPYLIDAGFFRIKGFALYLKNETALRNHG